MKQSAKARVLALHPEAVIDLCPLSRSGGTRVVLTRPNGQQIGRGPRANAAWAEAARNLSQLQAGAAP